MKPVRLFADKIKDNLRTDIIGREIVTLERTVSAMDTAKQMLKEGAIEGTTIFVEEQTQGKRTDRKRVVLQKRERLVTDGCLKTGNPTGKFIHFDGIHRGCYRTDHQGHV